MEYTEKVNKGIETAKTLVEKLGKAFNELGSRRDGLLPNKTRWADVKEYLDNLEESLHEKLDDVTEKEILYEEKQSEACKLIAEREASIAESELASWDRLQELKDAASSAIAEACRNCKAPTPPTPLPVDVKGNKDEKKVRTSAPENLPANKSVGDMAEAVAVEAQLQPQLKKLCKKMDAKGIVKFLSENRKLLAAFLSTIRDQLSTALESAADPASLVLDSLEGFYPPDAANSNALQVLRRTCLVVMEAAAPLLGGTGVPCSDETKQRARAVADDWKAKLAGIDIEASRGCSLEAGAFLQLLVTFKMAQDFHEDELCKLVLAVSRRRQAPELCRSLGLTHRMPGVVETLVKSGRQLDAVHFACSFELTESFPPVPMLKEYYNNVRETIGDNAAILDEKDINKELGALKVVIKCIEDYRLHEDYPVEPLTNRVAELEKAKTNKKRLTQQAAKCQPKKPRTSSAFASRKPAQFPAPPPAYSNYAEYGAPIVYQMPSHAPYAPPPSAVPGPYPYQDSASLDYNYGTAPNYGAYGYDTLTANGYGSFMGTGAQPAAVPNYEAYMSPNYEGDMSVEGQQPPQPYMQ